MDVHSTPACIIFLICLLYGIVPVTSCPNGANVTCCACVSNPGCSWYSPPDRTAYCDSSPYLTTGGGPASLPAWAAGGSGVSPSQASEVIVTADEPFHLGERRLLRPQAAIVKLAVGIRHQFAFLLSARSARTRLIVRGPARASNGYVEFGLRPADDDSCSQGLLEFTSTRTWSRSRSGGRRGTRAGTRGYARLARSAQVRSRSRSRSRTRSRSTGISGGRGYPRRRVYSCRGDGPGVVHTMFLELDVKRCLVGRFTLTLIARDSGTRSRLLRVKVKSLCECPGCSSSDTETPGGAGGGGDPPGSQSGPSPQPQLCNAGNGTPRACGEDNVMQVLSPQATLCLRRGVNDVCLPAGEDATLPHGQTCSGHGVCVCGTCACGPRHELYTHQRYTGQYCECDDYSCEYSADGQLCGGVTRGVCQCGQCVCQPGWSGDACDESLSVDACIQQPDTDTVCSGRGMCMGGVCDCPWPYSGQFCECDSEACPRHQGELCGGGDRGQCVCEACVCAAGYSGTACQHGQGSMENSSNSGQPPASCMSFGSSADAASAWPLVCSGRGVCVDGQCACPTPYTGALCQDCPSC